jgi:hypothetical protein
MMQGILVVVASVPDIRFATDLQEHCGSVVVHYSKRNSTSMVLQTRKRLLRGRTTLLP